MLIIWQDIKSRKINNWILFCFGLAGIGWQLLYEPVLGWIHISFSLALALFILVIVGVWAYLAGKQEWLDNHMGISDISMLIGIACWFSPEHFLFFYTLSAGSALVIINLLVTYKVIKDGTKVPLAALLGIIFVGDMAWHLIG